MLPWRTVALGYRIVFALATVWGLALLFKLDEGWFDGELLVFYTTLSNLLVLGWTIASVVVTLRDGTRDGWRGYSSPNPRLAGFPLMAITVTMLVYLILLAPTRPPEELFTLQDTLVHVVVPVMMLLDWVLFTPRGAVRAVDPLLWALPPYAYLLWAFAHRALGNDFAGLDYPYPFMNIDVLGWGGFLVYLAAITIALEAVGYVLYGVDRYAARTASRRPSSTRSKTDSTSPVASTSTIRPR